MQKKNIYVIIPAMNEELSIGAVLCDIPDGLVIETIVVDNASIDNTALEAAKGGAVVLRENTPGYGAACLKGMAYLASLSADRRPDIVVFIDGDYSDYPGQMRDLIEPILMDGADMVIGSRALGQRAHGSMTVPQIFGNWLATFLLKWLYGVRFTDLGPFRAIRYDSLLLLGMQDMNYGWTVEMQLKAAKKSLKCREVPVDYKKRIGVSKVSGTVKGTIMAGYKILYTIFKYL
jgi:glycosyltransferase involved in cell wall biosynthesis